MENRINKVVELEDGRQMFIVNQVNYKGRIFFLANETIGDDVTDNFMILEEVRVYTDSYVEEVEELELFDKILTAFETAAVDTANAASN